MACTSGHPLDRAHLVDGPAPGNAESQGAGELDEANDLAHHCVLSANHRAKEPADGAPSGLSRAPRITQGGKPPQGVAAINPVMHQEASEEGVHLCSPRAPPGNA
jgi:hypothetical protein